ncbi:MAG: polymer-forming cytoskeletal protein [Armatimonadota bacterium]|nr:polymer-forming cytoskeletal protein [Armatimonadota bacterium]
MKGMGVAAALVLALAAPVEAFVVQTGDVVTISTSLADDLYAAGTAVSVTGTVDGDVVAAGQRVEVIGRVTGGVLAAAREVRLDGQVGRAVRAVAQTMSLTGTVGTDAVVAAATVTVTEGTRVGRDLVVAGEDIRVAGEVSRYLRAAGGTVVVAGRVGKGLRVDARRLTIMPTAVIGGDVRYSADAEADIRPGARISGSVQRVPPPPRRPVRVLGLPVCQALRVWEGLGLLVLGLVAAVVAPQAVRDGGRAAMHRLPANLAAGVALLVVIPVLAIALAVSIVGIPLAAILVLLLAAVAYGAQPVVAAGVGQVVLALLRRTRPPALPLAVLLGTVILTALYALPYGWIVRLTVAATGAGTVGLAAWRARR